MNGYLKPFFTHETEGNNFYVNASFQIPYSVHVREGVFTMNKGERTPYTFEAEQTPQVKLYISKENRLAVNELDSGSKELFLWILFAAPKSDDLYWLNRKRFMKECNVKSLGSYLKYVKSLIKAGVIAPTGQTKDVFWLNPRFFFRGDKLEKYKDHKVLLYSYNPNGEMGTRQIEKKEKLEAEKKAQIINEEDTEIDEDPDGDNI